MTKASDQENALFRYKTLWFLELLDIESAQKGKYPIKELYPSFLNISFEAILHDPGVRRHIFHTMLRYPAGSRLGTSHETIEGTKTRYSR